MSCFVGRFNIVFISQLRGDELFFCPEAIGYEQSGKNTNNDVRDCTLPRRERKEEHCTDNDHNAARSLPPEQNKIAGDENKMPELQKPNAQGRQRLVWCDEPRHVFNKK